MKVGPFFILLLGAVAAFAGLSAPEMQLVPSFGAHFTQAQTVGAFVLADGTTENLLVWNPARAMKRFIPASTFKIANSLIGVECGAVKSVDQILPYGGKPQPFKEWEKDASLREAIKISSVPIYQELARRIGLERMAKGVAALDYGNRQIGGVVDHFWLDGPLEISAVEQVRFLRRLLASGLPLKPSTMEAVRQIVPTESVGKTIIHFKTGWGTATKPNIGWIVGWVESGGANRPFALNLDMDGLKDAPKRMLILKGCLRDQGLLPNE